MIYFTSDNHFGHTSIIKFCNRPYKDVEEMNEAMIKNWNSVVTPKDQVWHIGDFSFADEKTTANIARRLNGHKFLVAGNHDNIRVLAPLFEQHYLYHEIKHEKQLIVLCHYAFRIWNKSHYGSWNLYGHSHGTLPEPDDLLSMDVGVDSNNYTPISFEQVKQRMATKTFVPIDHHGKKG